MGMVVEVSSSSACPTWTGGISMTEFSKEVEVGRIFGIAHGYCCVIPFCLHQLTSLHKFYY